MPKSIDAVDLTQNLIRCNSVTPAEGGAIVLLEKILSEHGFCCWRVDRGGIANLYARWGDKAHPRCFGFGGHTDVVPEGDAKAWRFPPFGGQREGDKIYGRGAADMKSGVAAFVSAAVECVQKKPDGAIVLLITGDEEGDAHHGTRALLDWMTENEEKMSLCLVGEPTSATTLGDMVKIGRRGSMRASFTVKGIQGHSAYPDLALNPLPPLARLITALSEKKLDQGSADFASSTLSVTTIDTGNPAHNVIPGDAHATVNIRFNDQHNSKTLGQWLAQEAAHIEAETGVKIDMKISVSGESFLTPRGELSALVADAIQTETGNFPKFSTTGGTSDARFIKDHCPVVEFGLVGQSMHQINECVSVPDILKLRTIYSRILQSYFA